MRSIALLFLCGLAAPALAAPARAAEPDCRNGSFAFVSHSFGLARVTAPRAFLRGDVAPCPDDGDACLGRAYVVRGDVVLTGDSRGAYVCAFYPGPNGGSAGYVREGEVARQTAPATTPLSAWEGRWANGDNEIRLRRRGTDLSATGDAFWPSANPSPVDRPGGPHIGEMSGEARPRGSAVTFAGTDAQDCRVDLTLLPPFLVARDNLNCGGLNVTFTGVYRRR